MSQQDFQPGFDPKLRAQLSEDLKNQEQQWRFEKSVQRSLFAFSFALLTVICLAIWASTLRPRIMIELYGGDTVLPKQHLALRAIARDPRSGLALPLDDATMQLGFASQDPISLDNVGLAPECADTVFMLSADQCKDKPNLEIALNSGGLWDDIRVPLDCSQTNARPPVPLNFVAAELSLKPPNDNQGATDKPLRFARINWQGQSVELRLYPESKDLVPILSNQVYLLALENQQLVNDLRVEVKPPGWKLRTENFGVASFQITPGRALGSLVLTPLDAPPPDKGVAQAQVLRPQTLVLKAPPSQLLARARKVLAQPDELVDVDILSVRSRTLLSVELWYNQRLGGISLLPVDGGQAQLKIPCPKQDRSIVALRLQHNLVGADQVRDEAFVYVDSASPSMAWRHFAQRYLSDVQDPGLRALAQVEVRRPKLARELLRLALSRAEIPTNLQRSASNQQRNTDRVLAIRARWQFWLMSLYWILGAGALLLAVIAVLRHNQQLYRRLVDFANDAEDDQDPKTSPQRIRRRAWVELGSVVIGILFGLYIVYFLISRMWWG